MFYGGGGGGGVSTTTVANSAMVCKSTIHAGKALHTFESIETPIVTTKSSKRATSTVQEAIADDLAIIRKGLRTSKSLIILCE